MKAVRPLGSKVQLASKAQPRRKPKVGKSVDLQWPDDMVGHVFIKRAIDRLGRSSFVAWRGDEIEAELPELVLPSVENREAANWKQVDLAKSLLEEAQPRLFEDPRYEHLDVDPAMKPSAGSAGPLEDGVRWPKFLWKAAEQAFAEKHHELCERREHWNFVEQRLVSALRSGTLRSYVRNREGGGFQLVAQELWNTEKYRTRFETGLIDPENPFDEPDDGWGTPGTLKGYHYLYVDEAQLRALEGAIPSDPWHDETWFSLPERVRYLVKLALKLNRKRPHTRFMVSGPKGAEWLNRNVQRMGGPAYPKVVARRLAEALRLDGEWPDGSPRHVDYDPSDEDD